MYPVVSISTGHLCRYCHFGDKVLARTHAAEYGGPEWISPEVVELFRANPPLMYRVFSIPIDTGPRAA